MEDKMRRICDAAEAEGRRGLTRTVKQVSSIVRRVLADEEWHELPAVRSRDLNNAIDELRGAARIASAAEYVRERVLNAPNGRVIDLRLDRDLLVSQQQIHELFDTGEAPRRGFVYVAWCQRPEEYWYIGKAGNASRLNLSRHGKLANAAAHATQLSLLFPAQSMDEILLNVEASAIALVEYSTGNVPRLNQQPTRVPEGAAERRLEKLTDFLTDVGAKVSGA